jgi:nucleoside-diphosphate-sugar epimerase
MPTDLQVLLGATGRVGQALVQALAAQGAQVRAVNRSGRALVPASRWPGGLWQAPAQVGEEVQGEVQSQRQRLGSRAAHLSQKMVVDNEVW